MISIQLSEGLLTSDSVSRATRLINQQQTLTLAHLLFTDSLCLYLDVEQLLYNLSLVLFSTFNLRHSKNSSADISRVSRRCNRLNPPDHYWTHVEDMTSC